MTNDFVPDAPNVAHGTDLLKTLAGADMPCVFMDAQYRVLADFMKFGNEGKSRMASHYALPQMTEADIIGFMVLIEAALRPSGHLFMWLDKFTLCTGAHLRWMMPTFEIVDLITWNKGKIGMGFRTRRACEYLIVMQKRPKRAKDVWTRHDIPDTWSEGISSEDRTKHPHRKPVGLQGALIRAVTRPGEFVVDPCAGSYSVMEAAHSVERRFIGCDLIGVSK